MKRLSRIVLLLVFGLVLIGGGAGLFVFAPKPSMKYEPRGRDTAGNTVYKPVPADQDAYRDWVFRKVSFVAGGVFLVAGVCLSSVSIHFIARRNERLGLDGAPIVYLRIGGQHFHKEGCPYLQDFRSIPQSQALQQGLQPCPLCDPPATDPGGNAFIRKGGGHFYREDCLFMTDVRGLPRLEALAAGFKPCHRCGA
jgi:hypothetical protein